MADADKLLAEWAASEFGFKPEEFVSVDFETYIGCYSDVTHEYGVNTIFTFIKDGETHTELMELGLPDLIYEMTEYKRAEDRACREHDHECPYE